MSVLVGKKYPSFSFCGCKWWSDELSNFSIRSIFRKKTSIILFLSERLLLLYVRRNYLAFQNKLGEFEDRGVEVV